MSDEPRWPRRHPAQDVTARAAEVGDARMMADILFARLAAAHRNVISKEGLHTDADLVAEEEASAAIDGWIAGLLARDLPGDHVVVKVADMRPLPTRYDVLRVLAENGLTGNGSPHAWRCDYPERYGPCDCVADLATDLVGLLGGEAR